MPGGKPGAATTPRTRGRAAWARANPASRRVGRACRTRRIGRPQTRRCRQLRRIFRSKRGSFPLPARFPTARHHLQPRPGQPFANAIGPRVRWGLRSCLKKPRAGPAAPHEAGCTPRPSGRGSTLAGLPARAGGRSHTGSPSQAAVAALTAGTTREAAGRGEGERRPEPGSLSVCRTRTQPHAGLAKRAPLPLLGRMRPMRATGAASKLRGMAKGAGAGTPQTRAVCSGQTPTPGAGASGRPTSISPGTAFPSRCPGSQGLMALLSPSSCPAAGTPRQAPSSCWGRAAGYGRGR